MTTKMKYIGVILAVVALNILGALAMTSAHFSIDSFFK